MKTDKTESTGLVAKALCIRFVAGINAVISHSSHF